MSDFNAINNRLWVGAAINGAGDVDDLLNAGITSIIDCRAETDDAPLLAGRPGVAYLWCPTADDGQTKTPDYFAPGIRFALDEFTHTGRAVYTHCAAGINRGPSMAAAILIAQGWPTTEAAAMIRRARPQVGLAYLEDAAAAVIALGYV